MDELKYICTNTILNLFNFDFVKNSFFFILINILINIYFKNKYWLINISYCLRKKISHKISDSITCDAHSEWIEIGYFNGNKIVDSYVRSLIDRRLL